MCVRDTLIAAAGLLLFASTLALAAETDVPMGKDHE